MNLTRRPDPAAAYPFRPIDFRPIDGPILSEGTPEWFSQRRPARSRARCRSGSPAACRPVVSFGQAPAQTAEALDTFRYTTPRCNAEWE